MKHSLSGNDALISAMLWTIITLYWISVRNEIIVMSLTALSAIVFYSKWIMEKNNDYLGGIHYF